jgi:hypothetical protein
MTIFLRYYYINSSKKLKTIHGINKNVCLLTIKALVLKFRKPEILVGLRSICPPSVPLKDGGLIGAQEIR